MDPGWDHTENEDKHLLAHTLGMDKDMGTDMDITWVNTARGGCGNDKVSTADRLTSFLSEYTRHLSNISLNISNKISYTIIFNPISNIDFYSYFVNPVDTIYSNIVYIYRQFQSCNSTRDCKCDCKCEPTCTGNFIWLCLCANSEGEGKECCICICKHKDNSKCLCICVCNKAGGKCCCLESKTHECKECLVKVDINSLLIQTWKISGHLNCIKCYISRIEKKCCLCSCCQVTRCNQTCCTSCGSGSSAGCCCCSCCPSGCRRESCQSYCGCKDREVNYLAIISRINWIELLFNQISTEILKLRSLKYTLSLISVIANTCKACPGDCCKDKIENLIKHIENALSYYYLFGSRIDDIRSFVEYKLFYPKSKKTISSLQKSVHHLSKQLSMINNYIVDSTRNNTSIVHINNLLMSVYSEYSLFQCYVVGNKLYECSRKIDKIFEFVYSSYGCFCIGSFENKNPEITNNYSGINEFVFRNKLSDEIYKMKSDDEIKRLYGLDRDGNHMCLCMVIKYSLYPRALNLVYVISFELEMLSTLSRKFTKYTQLRYLSHVKMIIMIINLFYKLCIFIQLKYESHFFVSPESGYLKCYCTYNDDKNYQVIVSIMLVLSSLMENIWSMDSESLRVSIESLSTLYSQLESYDLYSLNDRKKPSCNSLYTLLLNKDCKKESPCKGGEKCCCWCVTCFNLLVMLIYMCIQCKLCKAICNKQGTGCKIDDWKKICKIEDFKCKCQEQNNGLCCLLNLALCLQVPSSTGNGCKELEKLKECFTECQDENGCCKKILEKVKAGLCKLLLLGCCCNNKDGCDYSSGEEVKVKCLMFKDLNDRTSVAVVVFCKCKDPSKCCCLTDLVGKFKEKLSQICQSDKCACDELKNCEQLCCGTTCQAQCVCKNLKDLCAKICKGDNNNGCLCKKIDAIKDCLTKCVKGTCECKDKGGCCRCGWCKIVGMSLKILTIACRANVLEPYKRIVMELLNSTKKKKDVIRTIAEGINRKTLNNIYLVKNSYSSYPYSIDSYPSKINNATNVETRNWGYDTKYEHDVSTDKGFRRGDGYPHLTSSIYRTHIHNMSSFNRLKTYFIYYKSLNNPVSDTYF